MHNTYLLQWHLYGSATQGRVAISRPDTTLSRDTTYAVARSDTNLGTRRLRFRDYELKDHLGNVRVIITDMKMSGPGAPGSSPFTADMRSYQNYYPFGSPQPGRVWNGDSVRFGFNGQETTKELSRAHYVAAYWEYDSRICRRWNRDPNEMVEMSPYSCLSNSPIWMIDPKGDDDYFNSDGMLEKSSGSGHKIKIWSENDKAYIVLSRLDVMKGFPFNMSNWYAVTRIVQYYGRRMGLRDRESGGRGEIGLGFWDRPEETETVGAFSRADNGDVRLNVPDGHVSDFLEDDYYNLTNVLEHERAHLTSPDLGGHKDPFGHVTVYLAQILYPSWDKTTRKFKLGILGGVALMLTRAVHVQNYQPEDLDPVVNVFNKIVAREKMGIYWDNLTATYKVAQ